MVCKSRTGQQRPSFTDMSFIIAPYNGSPATAYWSWVCLFTFAGCFSEGAVKGIITAATPTNAINSAL